MSIQTIVAPTLSGAASLQSKSLTITPAQTGTVFTLSRQLGVGSSFSLITGTNSNLTLSGLTLQAAVALGNATTQQAKIREVNGLVALEYLVVVNSLAALPAASLLSIPAYGNNQLSVAFDDGANGGAVISSHNVYRGTVSGSETLLANTTSGSPYVDTTAANGTQYFYRFSPINSTGEGPLSNRVSGTASATNLAVRPLVVGMNIGFIYDCTDLYRDLSYCIYWMDASRRTIGMPNTYLNYNDVTIYQPATQDPTNWGIGWDGIPHNLNGGIIAFLNVLPCDPRVGAYDIVYTPSDGKSTISVSASIGCSSAYVASNHYTLTYTATTATKLFNPYILISFTGTLPPEGIVPGSNFTIRKQGDTSTLFSTDQFLADAKTMGSGPIRFMTPLGNINAGTWPAALTGSMIWSGPAQAGGGSGVGGQSMALAHCIKFCNESNRDLHLNIPDQCDTSYVTAVATYVKNNLKPSLKVWIEVSNEVWNTGFEQALRYQVRGCAAGYWNTNGDAAAITIYDCGTNRGKEPWVALRNTYALATLTYWSTQPLNGDTVTIGSKTYTFQTTLTDVDGNVQIGASASASLANLAYAIGYYVSSVRQGTPGTNFAASTVDHPNVSCTSLSIATSSLIIIQAKAYGREQNTIALSKTTAAGTWQTPTMVGGSKIAQVLGRSFNVGDYLYIVPVGGNGAGHMDGVRQVVQLTQAVNPNDILDYAVNCTCVINGTQTQLAGRRSHAIHTGSVVSTFASVYGTGWQSRVVGMLGAWYLDAPQMLVNMIIFGGLKDLISCYLPANYLTGVYGAGVDMLSYTASSSVTHVNYAAGDLGTGSPPWTKTERDLYNTDKESFKTAWFNVVPFAIDAWAAYLQAKKLGTETLLQAQVSGYVPNSIYMGAYEGLTFGGLVSDSRLVYCYPVTQTAANVWLEMSRDARMGTTNSYALSKLQAVVGGYSNAFIMTGSRSTGGYNVGRTYSWAIKEYQGQTGDPQGDAFANYHFNTGS